MLRLFPTRTDLVPRRKVNTGFRRKKRRHLAAAGIIFHVTKSSWSSLTVWMAAAAAGDMPGLWPVPPSSPPRSAPGAAGGQKSPPCARVAACLPATRLSETAVSLWLKRGSSNKLFQDPLSSKQAATFGDIFIPFGLGRCRRVCNYFII